MRLSMFLAKAVTSKLAHTSVCLIHSSKHCNVILFIALIAREKRSEDKLCYALSVGLVRLLTGIY